VNKIDCEVGFELMGKFNVSPQTPPGFQGGDRLHVKFASHDAPLEVVVTKVNDNDGVRTVWFGTPMIVEVLAPERQPETPPPSVPHPGDVS